MSVDVDLKRVQVGRQLQGKFPGDGADVRESTTDVRLVNELPVVSQGRLIPHGPHVDFACVGSAVQVCLELLDEDSVSNLQRSPAGRPEMLQPLIDLPRLARLRRLESAADPLIQRFVSRSGSHHCRTKCPERS